MRKKIREPPIHTRSLPTAADYAAIAIAPLLIFLMISGLVNFFVMLFYHGDFPARITWTLFFYTMGAVAIARIAIEQTRAYAHGYASILGIAGFFVMSGYLGSIVFTAFILFTVSYLADRIVHDCTLIDETVDASGQGLVDFGKELIQSHGSQPKRPKTHQPGRTVMWLALAALPLFGLGQFMLRDDLATWERAKFLLAIYLFASLSLLVTTSFLGLRRYLRQRGADMPGNVSVGWIAGGVLSILLVLFVAYLAPVPGQMLASITIPDFLDSPKDQQASRYGWGEEGAQQQSEDDAKTNEPIGDESTPPSGESQAGAKPGEAEQGNAKEAPPGSDPGGKKSGGEKSAGEKSGESESRESKSDSAKDKSVGEKPTNKSGSSGKQPSDTSAEKSESPKNSENAKKNPDGSDDKQQTENDQNGGSKSGDMSQDSENQKQSKERQPDDQTDTGDDKSKESEKQNQSKSKSKSSSGKNSVQRSMEAVSSSLPAISGMLRWLIMLGLLAIVAFFVWKNYEALLQWWHSLFGLKSTGTVDEDEKNNNTMRETPPRSFSSFDNPVGRENDPRRAVVITFQAFEAWAREKGWRRNKDETPSEFLKRISVAIPQSAEPASQIVDAYNRIVYGRGNATSADIRAVNLIWSIMKKSVISAT